MCLQKSTMFMTICLWLLNIGNGFVQLLCQEGTEWDLAYIYYKLAEQNHPHVLVLQ